MSSTSLISAYEFYKLAKWSVCPHFGIHLKPELISENDIIFLNLDYFIQFINLLSHNTINHKFILIIHNSYSPFTFFHFQYVSNIVKHIYTINSHVIHSSVTCIPIGFMDDIYISHNIFTTLNQVVRIDKHKDILLYSNFSIKNNKIKRIECLNAFVNKWVYKDQYISIEDYCKKIYRSKYVLAPQGRGSDTHRIYIAIYFNAIPIVITSLLDSFYLSFPIMVVDSWNDINETFLENNYELFYKKLIEWKNKHNEWTNARYWLNK